MSRNAYDTTLATWTSLLIATRAHLAELPGAAQHMAALEHHLQETRRLQVRRDRLHAEKQGATRQLRASLQEGADLAIRLRSHIQACLGIRDERLRKFGVAPRGKRRSRAGRG